MGEYTITQLSMKQSLLETQVERLEKLNKYLAEMCIIDMDEAVMNAIQDICSEIAKCSQDVKGAAENIGTYAFLAGGELKKKAKADAEGGAEAPPPIVSEKGAEANG